jgi:hypothetical protein
VAWVMLFLPRWLNSIGKRKRAVEVRELLVKAVPEQQHRWQKGVDGLLYNYVVVSVVFIWYYYIPNTVFFVIHRVVSGI